METFFDEAHDNNFLKIYPSQGSEEFEQQNGVKPLPLKKSLTCNPLLTLITRDALLGRKNDIVRLLPVCSNSQRLRLFENHGICSTRWEGSAGRRWPAWSSAPPATSSRPWKVNKLFNLVLTFFLVFVCVLVFVFVLTMIERHFKLPLDHVDPLLWVLGISGCSLLKDLEGWSMTSCCVGHPLLDQIIIMCGSKFKRPTDIRHNQECQGWILPTLLYVSAEMHRWVHWRLKRNLWQSLRLRLLGKVKANLVHLSCTPHTAHNSATRQQANVFEGLVPFCRYSLTFNTTIICASVRDVTLQKSSVYSVFWSSWVVCVLWDAAEFCVCT